MSFCFVSILRLYLASTKMSTKDELVLNYSNTVKEWLRQTQINESEFERIYFESVAQLERDGSESPRLYNSGFWKFSWHRRRFTWYLLVAAVVACNVKPMYRCVVCGLQEYIYPGLRLLRTLSVPLVAMFPGLTELYDETCLIQNPLFRVVDMECWPCSGVDAVTYTTRPDHTMTQHHKAPFVYKTNQQPVNLKKLKDLYNSNKAVFDKDASKIYANGRRSVNPGEMFDIVSDEETLNPPDYFVWRINRIAPAQVLRKLIPRPTIVPQIGQSTERFVLLDFSGKSFRLPDPECNFAFLLQVKGNRVVELLPAKECGSQCRSITVLLKESYLLWYNWWYWRPVIQSSTRNETSIAHMGSYC